MASRKWIRLVFVRHTQTDMNAQRRYSGAREKALLNEIGKAQADKLALQLSHMQITAIYASDLRRTRQVASRISDAGGFDVTYDARLREVDVGSMGGLTKDEALVRFPEDHFRTSSPCYDFMSIGGESREQVIARQIACFNDILARYGRAFELGSPNIVIVGHGTSLRTMLQHLRIEPPNLHDQGGYQFVSYSGV